MTSTAGVRSVVIVRVIAGVTHSSASATARCTGGGRRSGACAALNSRRSDLISVCQTSCTSDVVASAETAVVADINKFLFPG